MPPGVTERFPSLVPAAPEERCEAATAMTGERCRQQGFDRGEGERRCRGCRLAKTGGRRRLESCRDHNEGRLEGCRAFHCQICGASGEPGDDSTWGSMGRWTVVCKTCVEGMQFVPEEKRCGACGTSETAPMGGQVQTSVGGGA